MKKFLNSLPWTILFSLIQAIVIGVDLIWYDLTLIQMLAPTIIFSIFMGLFVISLILGMTIFKRSLWEVLKPWFLNRYYYELSRPVGKEDMDPVLVDDKGRTYYEFPGDAMNLPVARLMKQREYLEWLSAGINQNNLHRLLSATQEHIVDALKVTGDKKKFAKAMAKVNALITQIDSRREQIVPLDLFINMLSVMVIREDEDPMKWQETIHQEKCDFFMNHLDSYGFFFQMTAFKRLANQFSMSQTTWRHHLKNWRVSQTELEQILSTISSSRESSSNEQATESS